MGQAAAGRQRLGPLHRDRAGQRVPLADRGEVIAAVPADDGEQVRQRPDGLVQRQPDRVAAVDEPPGRAGVVVHPGHVAGQPGQLRGGADDVAAGDHVHVAGPDAVEVRPRPGRPVGTEVPAVGHLGQLGRLRLPADAGQVVGSAGVGLGVPQRQHRAPPEVQHRPPVLVVGADPQRDEPGRGAPRPPRVLPEADDLRRGPQRVAEPGRPVEHDAAVEEVRHHRVGGHSGLSDRDVPDQVGRGQHAVAEHLPGQQVRPGQRQPAADHRLVRGGQPLGQRHRRGREPLPDLEVLEVRPVDHDLHPSTSRPKYTAKVCSCDQGVSGSSLTQAKERQKMAVQIRR